MLGNNILSSNNLCQASIKAIVVFFSLLSACQPKQEQTWSFADKAVESPIEYIDEQIKTARSVPDLYAKRAEAYREAGDVDQALRDINQALMLSPENASFFQLRCELLIAAGDSAKALAACNKAETLGAEGFKLYCLLADLYLTKRDVANAQKYTEKAKGIASENWQLQLLLARLGLALADSAMLLTHANAVIERLPNLSKPYEILHQMYDSLGQQEKAQKILTKGITHVNDSLPLARRIIAHLEKLGQRDSANYWKAFLAERTPALVWESYWALAIWQEELQNYEKAAYWLGKGLTYHPEKAIGHNQLGLLQEYRFNKHSLAKEAYETALKLAPDNPTYLRNLLRVERKLEVILK